MNERLESIMVEFFENLKLLGPADPASTSAALAQIPLSSDSVVVDVGCGTGRQTLQLLQESAAEVIATDLHLSFLGRLRRLATELGLADRLCLAQADMSGLPLMPGSVDLLWCEGAIYNMGYERGLRTWLPLLRPGGHLCVSEAAYFVENPPASVREFWEAEYPAITTQNRLEERARSCGYRLVDSFRLPKTAWEIYYSQVDRRIDELQAAWTGDPERQQVLAAMRREVDVFRRYGDTYGYVFLLLQKPV